jgi:hypothetical protein
MKKNKLNKTIIKESLKKFLTFFLTMYRACGDDVFGRNLMPIKVYSSSLKIGKGGCQCTDV